MTELSKSLVSFGSYLFPIGTVVKTRAADTDIEESKMLGLDGTIAPPGVLAAHIVTLDIEIGHGGDWDPSLTPDDIDYLNTLDDLNDSLNNLFAQLEQGYQALTLGYTPARTIQAQKRKFTPAYLEGTARAHATVSMDFYAPDPRWLSVAATTIDTNDFTATNNGNMVSYPVITFTQSGSGPASAPISLQIKPGGGMAYIEQTLNLTLLAGDVLVINCDPRQRAQGIIYTPAIGPQVNGLYLLGTTGIVNTLGNNATFPYFLPGSNTGSWATGCASSVSVVYNDAYAL